MWFVNCSLLVWWFLWRGCGALVCCNCAVVLVFAGCRFGFWMVGVGLVKVGFACFYGFCLFLFWVAAL